jgi:hypothetical protein
MDILTGLEEPPSTARVLLAVFSLAFGLMGDANGGALATDGAAQNGDTGTAITRDAGSIQDRTSRFDTVQGVLLDVCEERGYGEACAKHLLGMLWKETVGDGKAIGDQGRARGWFQIHYKLHAISIDCAEDLRCSANWTIDYLESNSYPTHVAYAIQCHNGCNAGNGYAASALRHGERLWSEPMFLDGHKVVAMR